MRSLRARLFAALTTFIVATGLIAGGLAFRWAFEEAIELQDAILQQVGMLAANTRLQGGSLAEPAVDAEAQVVIEEFVRARDELPVKPLQLSLPPDLPNGLQTISQPSGRWRILVRTRSDGSRVAVGQPTANRDEIARDSALRTILPLAALIPCLLLLVGVVIHYSFRPVTQLAARLDAKQSDHLQLLPSRGMPEELLPFIASINRLLERVAAMFEQQRQFVAHAAHELRTPITALSLQAENLDHVGLSSEGQDRLTTLKAGIGRTAHLLEQLLALAKYEASGTAEAPITAVDRVAKEVVAGLLPIAHARRVDLGFERIDQVSVQMDATTLAVLLCNLLDNALRHSPQAPQDGRVDVKIFRESNHALIQIEDAGPGIPQAELGHIFEPFYRGSRPNGHGSGLGLSIVRIILEKHHGAIELDNITNTGCSGLRVVVRLFEQSHPRRGADEHRVDCGPRVGSA